jgi:acetylornithine deacetylase
MDPAIRLLRDLVAIDSVNPSLVPGAAGEGAIASAIAEHLRRLGLDVEIQDVAPGRPNVIGVLEGRARGRSLMLCGHVDTVGVEGMAAPFDPVERDGRLYGRGSQDMKGGVAAMIDAARTIAAEGLHAGRLIVAAVVDEEYASLGADALVTRWRADGAVVTEPTDLRIAIGHKGFAWFQIEARGRAAHGSRPREGRDAILRMGRVLNELEQLDRRLQAAPANPLLGTASLHASIIAGGRELSSYPEYCSLKLERRTVTGETDADVARELEAIVARLKRDDAEFDAAVTPLFARPPYELAAAHALPQALRAALGPVPDMDHSLRGKDHSRPGKSPALPDKDHTLRGKDHSLPDKDHSLPDKDHSLPDKDHSLPNKDHSLPDKDHSFIGMSFWTDAAVLGGAGIPSVLFGPGGAGLHSIEEYVEVRDVLRCRDTLAALARGWCGGAA